MNNIKLIQQVKHKSTWIFYTHSYKNTSNSVQCHSLRREPTQEWWSVPPVQGSRIMAKIVLGAICQINTPIRQYVHAKTLLPQ